MPINSVHPTYRTMIDDWNKCRDAFDGEKAIKSRGSKYLPRLSGMTDTEYNSYKERALFYSITGKTVSALVGMAMSRSANIKNPPEMNRYFVDHGGIEFLELYQSTLVEVSLTGRFGVLIDRPEDGGELTISRYKTENIINWKLDSLGQPIMVVLTETIDVQKSDSDEYEITQEIQYRKLSLVNGVYTVEIFNSRNDPVKIIEPKLNGQTIDYIPFFIVTENGMSWDVNKPPMLDIVSINISHYRTSADLEHGRHWTGLPTPVVSGVDDSTTLKIGSQTAWILPNENARAYMLEFTGQGLQSLEKALSEKQSQLASMSSRLLDNSKRGSEAADTVRLRYISETASLLTIVRSIESFLNHIYSTMAELDDLDPLGLTIQLNKEFLDTKLSSAEIRELISGYLEGAISKETLVFNLRRGDLLSSVRSDESEIEFLNSSEALKTRSNSNAT